MPAPIVHVEVRGLDAEELRRFYAEVFDWQREESRSIGDYSVGSLGAAPEVTAATGPVPEWGTNAATFYIQVDIDATLDHIERLGGRRVMPKQVGPPDFPSPHINVFTKFIDPAGNVVGLVERVG